jgi:hypothetical protein
MFITAGVGLEKTEARRIVVNGAEFYVSSHSHQPRIIGAHNSLRGKKISGVQFFKCIIYRKGRGSRGGEEKKAKQRGLHFEVGSKKKGVVVVIGSNKNKNYQVSLYAVSMGELSEMVSHSSSSLGRSKLFLF